MPSGIGLSVILGEKFFDGLEQSFHTERLVEVPVDTEAFRPRLVPFPDISGDHDDEGFFATFLVRALQLFQHEKPTPLGKHGIKQNEVGVGFLSDLNCRVTVHRRFDRGPGVGEHRFQSGDHIGIVLDDEDGFSFKCRRHVSSPAHQNVVVGRTATTVCRSTQ